MGWRIAYSLLDCSFHQCLFRLLPRKGTTRENDQNYFTSRSFGNSKQLGATYNLNKISFAEYLWVCKPSCCCLPQVVRWAMSEQEEVDSCLCSKTLQFFKVVQSPCLCSKTLQLFKNVQRCSKLFKVVQSSCLCSKILQLFEERKWVGGMKPNPPRSPTTFAAWHFVSTSSLDFLDQTDFSQIPNLGICLCYFCLTWLSFGAANIKETGV